MKVMKFGGTSVRDAGRIRAVCDIIRKEAAEAPVVAVLSAMKGITDSLIALARSAAAGDRERSASLLAEIKRRHHEAADDLFGRGAGRSEIDAMLAELEGIVDGISLVKECTLRSMDLVMGFGERLSCTMAAAFMAGQQKSAARYVDARSMIRTDRSYGRAVVDYAVSYEAIARALGPDVRTWTIPVVPGFIAADPDGVSTTLGRNGSDYTASILGAALGADVIEIWTDVDGVLSANPRICPQAFVIPELSYEEAMELSYFGAEVLHPYTMLPAVEKGIPIVIKNTLNPAAPGSRIVREVKPHGRQISGISSVANVALINVQGGGMLGVPGFAGRIFSALAAVGVNIIMISQASSEHSISIVIREEQKTLAAEALARELRPEIEARRVQDFEARGGLEIIAVIGDNMRGTPGISGKLFSACGEGGINILLIAQGSSERNISFVIEQDSRDKAINIIHDAFFPERHA